MEKQFEVIPAIDILNGKCVRLTQGRYELVEEFGKDPLEIAKRWIGHGATRLHIVDLDGARDGYPSNFEIITQIAKLPGIVVQAGGGIRTLESMERYFNSGVQYVVLGTKAFTDKDFLRMSLQNYENRIIVGLDLKDGKVTVSGWKEEVDIKFEEIKNNLKEVEQVIYTDVSTDGTLKGPNLKSVEFIGKTLKQKIIVSGGFSSIGDVLETVKLKKTVLNNITGVILGKSLYKGLIDLEEVIKSVGREL